MINAHGSLKCILNVIMDKSRQFTRTKWLTAASPLPEVWSVAHIHYSQHLQIFVHLYSVCAFSWSGSQGNTLLKRRRIFQARKLWLLLFLLQDGKKGAGLLWVSGNIGEFRTLTILSFISDSYIDQLMSQAFFCFFWDALRVALHVFLIFFMSTEYMYTNTKFAKRLWTF